MANTTQVRPEPPAVRHEEFCLPQSARGDGEATEARIEQFPATGPDRAGNVRTLLVTRCIDCGAARYDDPTRN